jgi:hypothetical protein
MDKVTVEKRSEFELEKSALITQIAQKIAANESLIKYRDKLPQATVFAI